MPSHSTRKKRASVPRASLSLLNKGRSVSKGSYRLGVTTAYNGNNIDIKQLGGVDDGKHIRGINLLPKFKHAIVELGRVGVHLIFFEDKASPGRDQGIEIKSVLNPSQVHDAKDKVGAADAVTNNLFERASSGTTHSSGTSHSSGNAAHRLRAHVSHASRKRRSGKGRGTRGATAR